MSRVLPGLKHPSLDITDDSGEERRVRFSYGELCELPDPVQRYFKFCMAEGQPRIKYCHIKQQGNFRYASYTVPSLSLLQTRLTLAAPATVCCAQSSVILSDSSESRQVLAGSG